jgi:toxin ParE1/3/4
VARFRLTKSAQADVEGIGAYTRDQWNPAQAVRYLTGLDACFFRLAETPGLGRVYRQPYLRQEYVSHVVFFRRKYDGDIVVVRILHMRMLPELHLDPSRDDEIDE